MLWQCHGQRSSVTSISLSPSTVSLYGKRCPREVLETRCLDEWVKVYEIHKHDEVEGTLSFWQRLRVHCKQGFRTSVWRWTARRRPGPSAQLNHLLGLA